MVPTIDTVGLGSTLIVIVLVDEHGSPVFCPITVYVVVVVGQTTDKDPVVLLGSHVYVLTPEHVRVEQFPLQMLELEALTEKLCPETTTTEMVFVDTQLFELLVP